MPVLLVLGPTLRDVGPVEVPQEALLALQASHGVRVEDAEARHPLPRGARRPEREGGVHGHPAARGGPHVVNRDLLAALEPHRELPVVQVQPCDVPPRPPAVEGPCAARNLERAAPPRSPQVVEVDDPLSRRGQQVAIVGQGLGAHARPRPHVDVIPVVHVRVGHHVPVLLDPAHLPGRLQVPAQDSRAHRVQPVPRAVGAKVVQPLAPLEGQHEGVGLANVPHLNEPV
mmetsp:Transcript_2637/g.9020  ORF Transcript_2637/g.9020 Transcript_2637/m.9020 type:complete len:229 (+) Transcript_2637:1514-2200(+)